MVKKWQTSKEMYYDSLEQKLGPTKEISKILLKMIEKRFELGMTQKELADKSGLKQSAIARMENFSVLPRLDTLLKTFRVLGLELVVENKTHIDIFEFIKEKEERIAPKNIVFLYTNQYRDPIKQKQSKAKALQWNNKVYSGSMKGEEWLNATIN